MQENKSQTRLPSGQVIIYQNETGETKLDVRFENETVWLTQMQMADLFGKSKKTISEHIRNIFIEGELFEKVVVRKNKTTTQHGAIAEKTQTICKRIIVVKLKCKTGNKLLHFVANAIINSLLNLGAG